MKARNHSRQAVCPWPPSRKHSGRCPNTCRTTARDTSGYKRHTFVREMKLWIVTLVLLAACLTQAVKVTATEAQQTQRATEEKAQQTRQERGQQTAKEEPQQTQKATEQKGQQTREEEKQQTRQTAEEKGPQTTEEKKRQTKQHSILFLYPMAPRSHSSFFGGIINALVDGGNHVTVVSPHKSFEARDEVRTVLVKEGDASIFVKDAFQDHRLQIVFNAAAEATNLCPDLLAKPEIQELLKEEYDVVILSVVLCDCFLSLVYQLRVPFIWVSPLVTIGSTAAYAGSPQFPSFTSTKVADMRYPLSFHQRAFATLFETFFTAVHRIYTAFGMERVCRQRGLCPPDMPSFAEMSGNASLVLLNSVKPLEFPARPSVPAELHLGGIHCRPAKPLPQELEAWVQGAGEAGFIFFSMGSVVKASDMPEKARVALLEVFATLDQRILWKWDQDTMKDLPPNVRLAKWLPQQDILGHPRLRLFITHGGMMSTMEASYHGAPVLGLPVFGDQHNNMQQTQAEGWGRYLLWEELTREAVRDAILGVMNDADIHAKAKHRATMMRDQPMTPAETVLFWVEYVIRHRGARHLRCPVADLPWYQLYNVDVWATVAAVVLVVTYVTFKLTKAMCSCLCCRRTGKIKKD